MKSGLVNKKFGRLTLLDDSPVTVNSSVKVHCLCQCGTKKWIYRQALLKGATKSCGCLNREELSKRGKHWQSRTPAHNSWWNMHLRCYCQTHISYSNYGGRGIKVCKRWLRNFANFLADMGPPPPGHSIDRIDNEKGYSPKNCRWATRAQQTANRRVNKK